jgi:hypothetical protein
LAFCECQCAIAGHEATRKRLSATKGEVTQSNMLDLELADYKRTADALQSKVG